MKRMIILLLIMMLVGCGSNKKNPDNVGLERLNEIYEILKNYHYSNPSDEILFEGAIDGMLNSLNDRFTYGIGDAITSNDTSSFNRRPGYGFAVSIPNSGGYIYIEEVFYNSAAYNGGLRDDDVIISINDFDLSSLSYEEILKLLERKYLETVKFGVLREYIEEIIYFDVRVEIIEDESVVSSDILSEDIGYLKIDILTSTYEDVAQSVINELNSLENNIPNMDCLIIDLRDNIGGSVEATAKILQEFVVFDETKPMFYLDGYHINHDEVKKEKEEYFSRAGVTKKTYDIKLLTNENTCSAAEIFVSVMSEIMGYDVIGETTYGKGIYQQDYFVDENYYIHITLGYWYYYDVQSDSYVCLQNKGYNPDYEVSANEEETYTIPNVYYDLSYDMVDVVNIPNICKMLNVLGFSVRTDGYYSSEVTLAVEQFQETLHGNFEEGIINSYTAQKIYEAYYDKINTYEYDNVLQNALRLLGE